MKFRLEICVDSVTSAISAQSAGADRVELCDNLSEGGTTPGFGTIISARQNLSIGLNVIIRPRGGDFLYNGLEYDIMRRDIELCGESGVDGIVTGILRKDGSVDVERTLNLVNLAHPMSVTFHRAFDLCVDPEQGLEDIISTGADRLLTSGQKNAAPDGIELLASLVRKAGNRIVIMPGGGLNKTNIESVARQSKACEFHLTGRKIVKSEMLFTRDDISMGTYVGMPEYSRKVADPELILSIVKILRNI
jgi:copper homeostasis protein